MVLCASCYAVLAHYGASCPRCRRRVSRVVEVVGVRVARQELAAGPRLGRLGAGLVGAVLMLALCVGLTLARDARRPLAVADGAVDAARAECARELHHTLQACIALRPLPVASVVEHDGREGDAGEPELPPPPPADVLLVARTTTITASAETTLTR